MRLRVPLVALVLLAIVAGCDASDTDTTPVADATKKYPCQVGERPGYFVPGPDPGDPVPVIGCARLGVSEKPVEFSAHAERIAGRAHVCVNPAYRGRGQLGVYIPSTCPPNPVPRRLDVLRVDVPDQGVRGYTLVVLGTANASTPEVVALHDGDEIRAAVFTVGHGLTEAVGAKRPFSVFVVELPLEAACQPIHVRGHGPSGTTRDRSRARPKHCEPR
jgi:hypothetical protein